MTQIKKPYSRMTTAELRQATREYDDELPPVSDDLPGKPLNPAERKQWKRVQKKMGRPKIGKGVKRVMIALESDLLKQSDSFARKLHLNRSQLISEGLRKLMAG